jgi:simple sugar transport system ATP-binding protein
VIGLAGLLGSGRTETAETIFGAAPADQGAAHLRGVPARLSAPREAVAGAIGYCPEDRKTHGIVGDLSLRENIILSLQARRGWLPALPRAKIDATADARVRAFDTRLANLDMAIRLLPGGNRQKALLARWLATEPDILIVDEPTRGIDVGAYAANTALIEGLGARGMALMAASYELNELLACATRVIVLRNRLQCATLARDAI